MRSCCHTTLAWLKVHHPEVFFAASMCFDMRQTDKLAHFHVDDMRRMEVACLPPDYQPQRSRICRSRAMVSMGSPSAMHSAGIKNVGEKAMEGSGRGA